VLGRYFHALIVIWCRFGRKIGRIVPQDMARLMACGGRGFAPDPRIFKAWTDASNDGFNDAEGRIAGVRRYALVCCATSSVASVPGAFRIPLIC